MASTSVMGMTETVAENTEKTENSEKEKTVVGNVRTACIGFLNASFDRIVRKYNELPTRRGGMVAWYVAAVFGVFFHFLLGAYFVVEGSQLKFDDAFKKRGGLLVGVLILGGIFSAVPLLVDTRPLLGLIGQYTGDQRDWIAPLVVDMFFTVLGNIQSLSGKNNNLAASLHECGFIIIGVVLTQIHLQYPRDPTGLTIGTMIAVSKQLSGFGQLQFKSTSWMEWAFGSILLVTAFICKFTEGKDPTQGPPPSTGNEQDDKSTVMTDVESQLAAKERYERTGKQMASPADIAKSKSGREGTSLKIHG